jgi:LysR family transcriptional regulator of abg operon
MKPNQLLAFAAVAEHGSIRSAARALGVSQPAVTKIVRELERELEAPLVERSIRGAQLTVYGEAFAPRARLLLADMARARDEIAQLRDGATGKVAVAFSTSFGLTVFPLAFKEFHARLPAVDVHFSEAVLPSMLTMLRNGSLDFAVAHLRPEDLSADFESFELFPVQLVGREVVAPIFSPLGLPPPARVIRGQSVTVALGLVGSTDLVGLFVEPLAALVFKNHGVRRVEVEENLPSLQVCVVQRAGQRLTPAARQLAECIYKVAAARFR